MCPAAVTGMTRWSGRRVLEHVSTLYAAERYLQVAIGIAATSTFAPKVPLQVLTVYVLSP